MNSTVKSIVHTILTIIGLYLPTLIASNPIFNMSVGGLISIGFNFLLSHYIPTTNGASAIQ